MRCYEACVTGMQYTNPPILKIKRIRVNANGKDKAEEVAKKKFEAMNKGFSVSKIELTQIVDEDDEL